MAIRDILRRDLYRGIVWWNRTQTGQLDGTKKQRRRPQSDWVRMDAPELRIVSDVLWEQVAERHRKNEAAYLRGAHGRLQSRPTGEDRRSTYLLSGLAKCVTCGGSLIATSKGAFGRSGATMYRCAYNHQRNERICTNKTKVRQDVLNSAILHAMSEALDERVLEASVATALQRLREREAQYSDQRTQLDRELPLIQTRLHHFVELIANGRGTDSVPESVHQEEARKKVVVGELARLNGVAHVASLDAVRVAKEMRSRLDHLPTLFARHLPQARLLCTRQPGHIIGF